MELKFATRCIYGNKERVDTLSGFVVTNFQEISDKMRFIPASNESSAAKQHLTNADVPQEVRIANGITDCVLRMPVGIKDKADLIADLKYAIDSKKT